MKSIYEQAVEMLKKNKEVELYRFVFTESGKLDFYTDKVYKAEDGEKITRQTKINVMGVRYRLGKIKCIGTALVKGELCLVKESLDDYAEYIPTLYFGDINEYSISISEAMKEKTNDVSKLYFLGKDGSLLGLRVTRQKIKMPLNCFYQKG